MIAIDSGRIPASALNVIERLEHAGFEAWLVGGCVRDLVLGRNPEDWDVATSALPEAVSTIFPVCIPTGIRHGTVTAIVDGCAHEITTFRTESGYSDFRRPDRVVFVSDLHSDLARRDFTINAMAWHPRRGLEDPFSGLIDLEQRCVRAVGDPHMRFSEDALRMLRAVRFSAQLDFDLLDETMDAIRALCPNIAHVSPERIRSELDKWVMAQGTRRWPLLRESGLMAAILPELDRCFTVEQQSPWHDENVGDHTLRAVSLAPPVRIVRWTLLLHDLGKCETRMTDETGTHHFWGHAGRSEALAKDVMGRLRWDSRTIAQVLTLIRHHDREVPPHDKAVRRAVQAIGIDLFPYWLEVRRGDCKAQNPAKSGAVLESIEAVGVLFGKIINEKHCLNIKELAVSGEDILEMGVLQGPEVGKILKTLLNWVLEDPTRNRTDLLMAKARDIGAKKNTGDQPG